MRLGTYPFVKTGYRKPVEEKGPKGRKKELEEHQDKDFTGDVLQ